jgi:transmembrane sensor
MTVSRDSTIKIDEAAGDWLAKRDSGNWSEADQRAFDAWLNVSTLHRVAYLRIERAWEEALRLTALGAGIQSGKPPPPGQWVLSPFFDQKTRAEQPESLSMGGFSKDEAEANTVPSTRKNALGMRFPRIARRFGLAASILLSVGFGFYALHGNLLQSKNFSTPVGGTASVPLPDGSLVTLNTNSRIHLAVTGTERKVELERGEAFFEVAKDPNRPFVVSVGNKRVIAVGTKFSVLREANDVRIVVTEGTVRVETALGTGQGTLKPISAGMVARATDEGVLLQSKPLAEAEDYLSWRSGVLVFRDVTLADAVAEFNRYNTRKIIIRDPIIAGMRVAGSFRSTNADAFVRLLQQGYPLRMEQDGDEIIMTAQ